MLNRRRRRGLLPDRVADRDRDHPDHHHDRGSQVSEPRADVRPRRPPPSGPSGRIHTAAGAVPSQYGKYATSLTELGPPASGARQPRRGGPDRQRPCRRRKAGYKFTVTGVPGGYMINCQSGDLRQQRQPHLLFRPDHGDPPELRAGAGHRQQPGTEVDAGQAADLAAAPGVPAGPCPPRHPRFCKLYTFETQLPGIRLYDGGRADPEHRRGQAPGHPPEFLHRRHLRHLGRDRRRAGPAGAGLPLSPAQGAQNGRVGRGGRRRQARAQLARGNGLPPQPRRRLEDHQRKEHRLGGEACRTTSVVAFGPQCTHLGCAYHWEEGKNEFLCPCHSSLFSIDGKVLSGPAPRPLDRYETQRRGQQTAAGPLAQSRRSRPHEAPLGRRARLAGPPHRHPDRRPPVPLRGDPRLQRLAPGLRQRGRLPVPGAGLHRRAAGLQLRAHARRRLQQPALHPDRTHRRPPHPRAAPLGRQHDDRGGGAPHGAGLPLRRLQEAARGHLDGGRGAAAAHPGLRPDRLSAALGQPRLLGHGGDHADCRPGAAWSGPT